MKLQEFVQMLSDFQGDLDLMARGHPYGAEDIIEMLDEVDQDGAEAVVLKKLLQHVG